MQQIPNSNAIWYLWFAVKYRQTEQWKTSYITKQSRSKVFGGGVVVGFCFWWDWGWNSGLHACRSLGFDGFIKIFPRQLNLQQYIWIILRKQGWERNTLLKKCYNTFSYQVSSCLAFTILISSVQRDFPKTRIHQNPRMLNTSSTKLWNQTLNNKGLQSVRHI
jgi:hypothetical protein